MDKIRFYKGLYEVKVVMESVGFYTIEALEVFEDVVDGKKIKVEIGEQRIVAPDTLYQERTYRPPIQEHAYELKMEKKLKELVANQERNNQNHNCLETS